MAEAAIKPDYAATETKEGYVRLNVKIEGLKVKGPGILDKIKHKHPHPEGRNAEIEVPIFHDRGFELNVRGGTAGEMKGAHYNCKIYQLPFSIEAEDSYITAKDGWVYIFLKKCDVHQSWEKFIRDDALETAGMD